MKKIFTLKDRTDLRFAKFILLLLPMCFFMVCQPLKAQLYQQQFKTRLAGFNNSSVTTGTYANSSPSNVQANALASGATSSTLSIPDATDDAAFPFTFKTVTSATGSNWAVTRTSNFTSTPTAVIVKFDINSTVGSSGSATKFFFYLGSSFSTSVATEANANVHSGFGIRYTSSSLTFTNIAGTSTSSTFTHGRSYAITFATNNSGSSANYTAPDGTTESVANDTWDLWVGNTKVFNDLAATTASQSITNFKFGDVITSSAGRANNYIDNLFINDLNGNLIPTAPTANSATGPTSSSFNANWSSVAGATGYRLDVSTVSDFSSGSYTNLGSWNFPNGTDDKTIDGGLSTNNTQTIENFGSAVATYGASGATTSAATATNWDAATTTAKYWQVELSTTGYYKTRVSSKQRSSGTGPRDFKLQYRIGIGGNWLDVPSGTIAVTTTDYTTGVLTNLSLPSSCDNQPSVFLRWIVTSTTSQNAGTVAAGGTSNIDDILIEGDAGSYVSGWNDVSVGNVTTFPVNTGLSASTTYYYRVRTENGTGTSVSSNTITTATTAAVFPDIDILDNGTQIAAANIYNAANSNIIYSFKAAVTTADAVLNSVVITTSGNYTATDLTNLKLWYNSSNNFGTASAIKTITPAGATTETFSSLSQTITNGNTGYFWITADVASSGVTAGHTITVAAITTSSLTFASGNKSSSVAPTAGGQQTIITAPAVTTNAASSITTTSVVLNGTINANAGSTTASFDHGTTNSYGTNAVADQSPVTGTSNTGITKTISSLGTNTLYHFRAKGANSAGTTNGSDASFTTLSNAPVMDNATARNPASNSFTANWTAPSNGGSETYTYTIEVNDDNTFTNAAEFTQSGIASGTLNTNVNTGLSSGTTYYYRVKAVNAGGSSAWSATSTSVTTTSSVAPTVTTAAVTSISITTATAGGNITSDGGASITDRGVVYNTTSPAETGGTTASEGGTTTGAFTKGLTTLSANTLYYVKAYGTNSAGTGYGSEVSFTTMATKPTQEATVSFGTKTNTTLVLNFTGGNGGRRVVFVKQGSSVSFTPTDGTSPTGINAAFGTGTQFGTGNYAVYDGTGTTVTVTGLTANTTYHIAVYEYNNNSAGFPNYYATGGINNTTTYNPTITVTGSLSAFGNQVTGTNSSSQSYTVSGTELASSITITAPAGFAISLDDVDYSVNPIVLAKNGSDAVASTTIYARFSPSSANGANSGNIAHTATDATTKNQAVSGNALATKPTTNGTISFGTVTSSSIVVNLPTVGDGGNRIIVVRATSAVSFTPTDGANISGTVSNAFGTATDQGSGNKVVYQGTGSGSPVVTVTGLSSGTTYHFAVYEYNVGTGTSYNYYTSSFVTGSQATPAASNATDAFRSFVTGNWNSTSTWESFTNGGWMAATLTPDNNASNITIQNGHTVTTTANVTVDQVTINDGGVLIVGSGATLTVNDGTGTDITVDATSGTPSYNGDQSTPGGILQIANGGILSTSTSSTITVNGTFDDLTVPTNNSTAYAYNVGSGSMTISSTGTYKISGLQANNNVQIGTLTNVSFNATGTLYIASGQPRLPNSFTGNVTWNVGSAGSATIISNSNAASISGNFNVVATGGGSNTIYLNSGSTARTLTVGGNTNIIGGQLELTNGTGTAACVLTTTDLNITGGTFYISGTTSGTNNAAAKLNGNLSHTAGIFGNNATNAASGASLQFTSTSANQTSSTTGLTGVVGLTINNTKSGGTVTLSNAVSVNNVTLTAGTLLSANNLTVAAAATVTRTAGSFSGSPVYGSGVNVTFTGSSASSGPELNPASGTLGTLTINSSGNTYTLSNAITVAAVTITAGTLDASTSNYGITVSGNWASSGTFTARSGTVTFNGTSAISGTNTFNNLTVAASSSVSTAAISIKGDLTNGNSFTASGAVTFNGTANQSITGSGSTMSFTSITINNSGTFPTGDIVEVSSSAFTASAGFLTLTAGVFKLSGSFTLSNTFFSTAGYTIGTGSGLWLNNANATVTGQNGSPTLNGLLRISAGTYNAGSSNNSMTWGDGSIFTMEGGAFNVAARFAPSVATSSNSITFTMSGGTLTTAMGSSTPPNASTTIASFDIPATGTTSSFTMSGGTIAMQKVSSGVDFRMSAAGTVNITGGTVQFGNASSSGSPNFQIGAAAGATNAMPALSINATGTPTVTLNTAITVSGNITIGTGTTLNANGKNISVTGNWNNNSNFTNTNSTVTFNGTTAQTITKSGGESFNNFTNSNTSNTVTAANNITVAGTFNTSANSILDMGTNTLSVGTVSSSGTIKSSNTGSTPITTGKTWAGTVEYNSSSAQTVVTGTYNNLTASSGSTKSMGGAVTVGGALNISSSSDKLSIGSNTLTLNGSITGSGFVTGSSTSNISIGGSGSFGSLMMDQSSADVSNMVNNLTMNRTGQTATLGNALRLNGVLTPTAGVIASGGNLTIASTSSGTARIAAGSSSGGYITGDVTVERYITALNNRAYRLLTPSVNTSTSINANWQEGQTNPDINTNMPAGKTAYGTHITGTGGHTNGFDETGFNQASLYTYDQGTPAWVAATSTSGTLSANTGYLLFVRGNRDNLNALQVSQGSSNTTLRATGTLPQGDMNFTSLASNTAFSLVTNPYASPILWSASGIYTGTNATNFENYITIWDPNVGTRGGYITIDKDNVRGGGTTNLTNEIQSGQAFFVQTQTGINNPSLSLLEANKSTTNNLNVFRGGTQTETLSTYLFFTNGTGRHTADGVTSLFKNGFSASVDGNDAKQMDNWDEDVSISREGKSLSIERRPLVDASNDTIPLKVARLKVQAYEWEFQPSNFTAPDMQAYLVDSYLGTETAISLSATTVVPFTVTSNAATSAANRFSIVFKPIAITNWTGATSTDFADASNWDNGLPSTSKNAVVPQVSNLPVLSSSRTINSITLNNGVDVTLAADLNIKGNLVNNGSIKGSSNLLLNGSNAQTISGKGSFGNLVIENTAGVSIENGAANMQDVTGTLTLKDGVLNTNNNLTLKSTSITNTAIIAAIDGTTNKGGINGKVIVERYIPAGKRGFRFIAPGVSSTTSIKANWQEGAISSTDNPKPGYGVHITGSTIDQVNGFDATLTGAASLFLFDNNTQSWGTGIANTDNTNLLAGNAYRLFVRGNRSYDLMGTQLPTSTATTLRATGNVLTGQIKLNSTSVGATANMPILSANADAYSFVGNPYIAPLDWGMVNKTDITGYYYIWDPTLGTRGAYVSCFTDGTKSNPSSAVTKDIQPGQAFFVQNNLTITTGPELTIEETHKSGTLTNVFRNQAAPVSMNIQLFVANNTSTSQDGAVALFDNSYSNAVNNDDATKMVNLDENMAIVRNSKSMSIERRAMPTLNDTMFIKLWQLGNKDYSLKFDASNFSTSMLQPYLQDTYLNKETAINLNGLTNVPFTANSSIPASMATNRFRIVFRTSGALPVTFTTVKAYQKNQGIQVDWNVQHEVNMTSYEVEKSIDGASFKKSGTVAANGNAGSSNYGWFDASPVNGTNYYRIKSMEKSGKESYSQTVKVTIGKAAISIAAYPNPFVGNSFSLQLNNLEKGNYTVSITNSIGQEVFRKAVAHNGGSATQTIDMDGKLAIGTYQIKVVGEGASLLLSIIKQ